MTESRIQIFTSDLKELPLHMRLLIRELEKGAPFIKSEDIGGRIVYDFKPLIETQATLEWHKDAWVIVGKAPEWIGKKDFTDDDICYFFKLPPDAVQRIKAMGGYIALTLNTQEVQGESK